MWYPGAEDQEEGHVEACEGEGGDEGGDQLREGGGVGGVIGGRADLYGNVKTGHSNQWCTALTLWRGTRALIVGVTASMGGVF